MGGGAGHVGRSDASVGSEPRPQRAAQDRRTHSCVGSAACGRMSV